LTMLIYLCAGSITKGFIMAAAGLAVSMVGQDNISGSTRFTLGSITLMDGVGVIPVAMGMFGIGEVLTNIEEGIQREVLSTKVKGLLPNLQDWKDSTWPIIRGTLVGFFMGVLPGGGGVITTFLCYSLEKKLSKHPEKFGTGVIEGVAAPETSNNAATGGSMVTLLSLGVPANVSMAVLLGAFIIHGVQPGPLFLARHPDLFWGTIASMYIGNVMLVILNLPLIGLWVKILKIPYSILFPLILLFCFIGVYSINNNIYEILIMMVFGYIIRKFGYEGAPFLLAMILGPMLEKAFRQSMLHRDPFIMFKRPISVVFLCIGLFLIISPIFSGIAQRRRRLIEEENKV
jgi:putative tricarboxylic transport membrane protein